jgi:AbiJ N-terminal domain 3
LLQKLTEIVKVAKVNTSSEAVRISGVTRRKLAAIFTQICWWGELEELDFLERLYKLDELPSTDTRVDTARMDIATHRISFSDWDDNWIFTDKRFDLDLDKPDRMLLSFLAETLHPEVRSNAVEVRQLAREINALLLRDGWMLTPKSKISGYPVYGFEPCAPSTTDLPQDFPLDLWETVISLAEVLKVRGQARELAVIATSNVSVAQTDFDNWNGGTRLWTITFQLEPTVYANFEDNDRNKSAEMLKTALAEFFQSCTNDQLENVVLVPSGINRPDWREAAQFWLSGQGITNQGRVRSDNPASLECDGLLFRSQPEIYFYKALKATGVTFAPLAVFLCGGKSYSRFEPDFLIVKDRGVFVVEIDGDTYHRETPADADVRLNPLRHEGAHIERVKASDSATEELAKACVKRILDIFEKINNQR